MNFTAWRATPVAIAMFHATSVLGQVPLHMTIDKPSGWYPPQALVQDGGAVVEATSPTAMIVGDGRPVTALDTFPEDQMLDVVAVGRRGRWHCTGVLVAPGAVLTARHCIPADVILVGADVDHGPHSSFDVIETRVPQDARMDVGLLVLKYPVPVPRIRLRRQALENMPPLGLVRIVGFGETLNGQRQTFGQKRRGDLEALGWGCDQRRPDQMGCLPSIEMLVPGRGGTDSCNGDSGGPILERHANGWRLLGITSRGLRSAQFRCGSGGIYTRADRLAPWLDTELQSLSLDGGHP